MNPPIGVFLMWCPVCGRHDRWVAFTGKSHFSPEGRCPGVPVKVNYELAAAPEVEE